MCTPQCPMPDFSLGLKHENLGKYLRTLRTVPGIVSTETYTSLLPAPEWHFSLEEKWHFSAPLSSNSPTLKQDFATLVQQMAEEVKKAETRVLDVPFALYDTQGKQTQEPGLLFAWRKFHTLSVAYVRSNVV